MTTRIITRRMASGSTAVIDPVTGKVTAILPATTVAPAPTRHKCDGCSGDGVYYGRGYVENGVFHGTTGTCFRCNGKGWQDDDDLNRNSNYDRYYRKVNY